MLTAGAIKRLAHEAIMLKRILGSLKIPAAVDTSNPAPQTASHTSSRDEKDIENKPQPPQAGQRFTSEENKRINERLR